MFFENSNDFINNQRRAKNKRSFIFQDSFGSYIDQNFISNNIIYCLIWLQRGVFFSRQYRILIYLSFFFIFLSFYFGFFIYFLLGIWFYYFFFIYSVLSFFWEDLNTNIDARDAYLSKKLDNEFFYFWKFIGIQNLKRVNILYDAESSVIPTLNTKLLSYNQKFQFLFISNYKYSFINFSYFYNNNIITKLNDFYKNLDKKLLFNKNIEVNELSKLVKDIDYQNKGLIIYKDFKINPRLNRFFNYKLIRNLFYIHDDFIIFSLFTVNILIHKLMENYFKLYVINNLFTLYETRALMFIDMEFNDLLLNFYNFKLRKINLYTTNIIKIKK